MRYFAGLDGHEEERCLALAFHLDLVEAGGLDLDVADLDLTQPDEVEELIGMNGIIRACRWKRSCS